MEGKGNMERLTERTGEGQAIPRMDLKNNGHQKCMERLADIERGKGMIGKCEFCGNEKELGDSTPFHGFYCLDCMRMNNQYDKESISKMKPEKRKKTTGKELKRFEKEKNDALKALMNFDGLWENGRK